MWSDAGVYVKTPFSTLEALTMTGVAPGLIDTFCAMHFREINPTTVSCVVALTTTDSRVAIFQFLINENDMDPSAIVPYKVSLLNVSSPLAWCLYSPDNLQVVFATVPSPGVQMFSVYTITTANDAIITPSFLCNVNTGSFPVIALQRWYGIFIDNVVEGFCLFMNENGQLLQTTLQNTAVVPGTLTTTQARRMEQRKTTSVYAIGTLLTATLFINDVVVVDPPFQVNGNNDVYYVSQDGKTISVIPDNKRLYRYHVASQTWDPEDNNLDVFYAGNAVRLSEGQLTNLTPIQYTQWFMGLTFSPAPVPPIFNFPIDLLVSRHQVFVTRATGVNQVTHRIEAQILQTNVWQLVTNPLHITELYDSGSIRVRDADSKDVIWDSGTNDQSGADEVYFAVLDLLEPTRAPGTLHAVSSPNGRYMLMVFDDRVDLLYNPWNMPRYTNYVLDPVNGTTLARAEEAQINFCIQALNNPNGSPIKFVDNHCACLRSHRMAGRVFSDLESLETDTQILLEQRTPCILKDCQLAPQDDYTVASLSVGNDCKEGLGVCGQFANNLDTNANLFIIRDCSNVVTTCMNSAQCPAGGICRNGQCVASCTNDTMCRNINPLAICIQSQCQVQNSPSEDPNKWSVGMILLAVLLAVAALSLLLAMTYLLVRKSTLERRKAEYEEST